TIGLSVPHLNIQGRPVVYRAARYSPLGSGCTLRQRRVSCLLITLSSSSASASLSRSITPISGRISALKCHIASDACLLDCPDLLIRFSSQGPARPPGVAS